MKGPANLQLLWGEREISIPGTFSYKLCMFSVIPFSTALNSLDDFIPRASVQTMPSWSLISMEIPSGAEDFLKWTHRSFFNYSFHDSTYHLWLCPPSDGPLLHSQSCEHRHCSQSQFHHHHFVMILIPKWKKKTHWMLLVQILIINLWISWLFQVGKETFP